MNRKLSIVFALLFSASAFNVQAQKLQPVDYVNTLMGTDSEFKLSNGNTYPAIALPWGMNFWTPQTAKMGDGWVYGYEANKIQ
jgi:putative alpha-1,2-mannosidase